MPLANIQWVQNLRWRVSVKKNSEDSVILSYATICETIKPVLGDSKIQFLIKKKSRQLVMDGKGRLVWMCLGCRKYPALLYRPEQSQF